MPKPITPIEKRFFDKVEKTSGCWLWKGGSTNYGYGCLWCNEKKGLVRAHVFSYKFHKGVVPPGMCVCHKCDVPACVNPDHLWLGTHAENMRDGFAKGRIKNTNPSRGENHHKAKLTWDQVHEIRSSPLKGYGSSIKLSKQYGVSVQIIDRIVNNRNWIKP